MTSGFVCPNLPPCAHAGWYHDVEEYGDPFPTCCVDGCGCGHVQGPMPEGQLPSWASLWERMPPISIVRGGLQWPIPEPELRCPTCGCASHFCALDCDCCPEHREGAS